MPRGPAWDKKFTDPIVLPGGRQLLTIGDAARYVTSLPKRERAKDYWAPAATMLRLVGENDGCEFFARLAVMHGLRKGIKDAPSAEPRRKRARAYKIVRAK